MESPTARLAQALRSLRRNRKFAILVVAILSVGIGPNTAIFSLIDRVLPRRQSRI
ncbi:MAG: hypothetical protein IRZ15_17870 [Bryobacteraceae bacterium]|nr:hypothetical protein [Bryobacteraceae bacterium]